MALALLGIFGIGALLVGAAVQGRVRWLRGLARNLLITYVFCVLLLLAGEVYFRTIYAESRMEFALTSDNWAQRYVQQNSLGWRDREWTPEVLADHLVVFAVGDSYTEGWGVDDPADRFPDVLGRQLGPTYAIVNLGFRGTATDQQVKAVENYPYQPPNVILWQYFINDIEVAAQSNGIPWEHPAVDVPPLANESYLASYAFWRINDWRLYVNTDGVDQWTFLFNAYDDPYIWDIHRQEIDRMIAYAEQVDARLITVIFPQMADPLRSVAYIDRVAQYIASQGHPEILKLFDAVAAWSLQDRIVAPYDTHASAAFHQYVGEALYQQFFAPTPNAP